MKFYSKIGGASTPASTRSPWELVREMICGRFLFSCIPQQRVVTKAFEAHVPTKDILIDSSVRGKSSMKRRSSTGEYQTSLCRKVCFEEHSMQCDSVVMTETSSVKKHALCCS